MDRRDVPSSESEGQLQGHVAREHTFYEGDDAYYVVAQDVLYNT